MNTDPVETDEDYTGHELDGETQLHYAGARYYMSALGRWASTDPLLNGSPEGLVEDGKLRYLSATSYNYTFNNPTKLTDPTGMAAECPPCSPSDYVYQQAAAMWNSVFSAASSSQAPSSAPQVTTNEQGTEPESVEKEGVANSTGNVRQQAVSEAEKYVDANTNPDGSLYEMGAKGGPGQPTDCSGLVCNSVDAAGGPDLTSGTGSGTERIVENTTQVGVSSVQAGDIVITNGTTHTGLVSGVERNSRGEVTSVTFIHSQGSTGPIKTTIRPEGNSYYARNLDSFRRYEQ